MKVLYQEKTIKNRLLAVKEKGIAICVVSGLTRTPYGNNMHDIFPGEKR